MMKKIIATLTLLALAVMTLGPALVVADPDPITTKLTKGTGGGSKPIVKAKWEAKPDGWSDDDPADGSQFLAPGDWNGTMNYKVCAIVTDPNGMADIAGVYADIYYPSDRAYSEDPANPDNHTTKPDTESPGIGACGAFIEENTLVQLSKSAGYDLFCNNVCVKNQNIITFSGTYTCAEICAADGELMKEEAYVYCDDKTLKWEDPAGEYKVSVAALDKAGNYSTALVNYFTYLPLTKFEKDFNSLDYGQVLLSTKKKISGDLNFGTANNPTIRNLGNTRLFMWVAQDDMGLGKSSGVWNVEYDARVGNHEADWTIYSPFGYKGTTPVWDSDYTILDDILELSEVEEMDFSIHVKKWPDTSTSYTGNMWLNATKAPFRTCPY